MSKHTSIKGVILLAFSVLMLVNTFLASGQQTDSSLIVISKDGLVIGTEKIEKNGNIYTMKDNLNSAITIQKANIILDGAGFKLFSSKSNTKDEFNNQSGIFIQELTNVTIRNIMVTGYDIGIGIYNSSYTIITSNKFSNEVEAVYLENSSNNWINDNNMDNAGAINLRFSNNNLISQNNFENGSGIALFSGSNNIVSQNNLNDLFRSATSLFVTSSNNMITQNNITNSQCAIGLYQDASNNFFSKNIIDNNGIGIRGDELSIYNNTFVENTILACKNSATYGFNGKNHSIFYNNNFINNTNQNVEFDGEYVSNGPNPPQYSPRLIEDHNWDNGTLGNYWSDYKNKYPHANLENAITYNAPYAVTPSNYPYLFYDYHPLVNPVTFSQKITYIPPWLMSSPTTAPSNQTFPTSSIIVLVVSITVAISAIVAFLLFSRRHKTNEN